MRLGSKIQHKSVIEEGHGQHWRLEHILVRAASLSAPKPEDSPLTRTVPYNIEQSSGVLKEHGTTDGRMPLQCAQEQCMIPRNLTLSLVFTAWTRQRQPSEAKTFPGTDGATS